MKTILIATDFSEASRNACLYGIELAAAFEARIILFSAYQQVGIPVTESAVLMAAENMRSITEQQLEKESKIISAGHSVVIETICREGFTADTILQTVRETKAELIIAAIKETDKAISKLFGSTITALTKKSGVPLIAIPGHVKFTPISNIAIANETDLAANTSSHLLDSLRELAELFHSKLYLVRIVQKNFNEAYELRNRPLNLSRIIQELDPIYECIEGKDVSASLNKFVKGYQVNLLVVLPHEHSVVESWFFRNTTRSIIFETKIPLLIIPQHVIETDPNPSKKKASV